MTMKRNEFELSLSEPLMFWKNKSAEEVSDLLGEETAKMVNYDQCNPHHSYDLFEHTLRTVSNIPKTAPMLVRTVAFFHDTGKPAVAQDRNDIRVYYGHAEKSAEIAEPILKELGYNTQELDEICFYIRFHDEFMSLNIQPEKENNKEQVNVYEKAVHKRMKKIMMENKVFQHMEPYTLWDNLLMLKDADIKAQADQVICNGVLIDSRENKLRKLEWIHKYVNTYEYNTLI